MAATFSTVMVKQLENGVLAIGIRNYHIQLLAMNLAHILFSYTVYTSMTISADGLGLISYFDFGNDDLKVAHCENTFCSPYFRRR